MEQYTGRTIGLAIFLLFLCAGCSGNDAPVPSSGHASPEAVAVSSGETAGDPGGGPARSPSRIGRIHVRISPTSPSRMSPPLLFVEGAPLKKEWEFTEVRWVVNGLEYVGGERMDPDEVHRGDRIRARGTVKVGGEEIPFETREIVAGNCSPEIGTVRLEPKAPTTGSKVKVISTCSDPDGDPVTMKYRWFIDDMEVPGEGKELALAGVRKGSWVHVQVATSDGIAEGSWKYSPKYQVVNALPVVKSRLPAEIPPDRKFSYKIMAEDPDGDPLTYTLTKSPPGMVLYGSTLEWKVPDEILGTLVEVVVNISDGDGGQTVCTLSMNIQAPKVGRSPGNDHRTGA